MARAITATCNGLVQDVALRTIRVAFTLAIGASV